MPVTGRPSSASRTPPPTATVSWPASARRSTTARTPAGKARASASGAGTEGTAPPPAGAGGRWPGASVMARGLYAFGRLADQRLHGLEQVALREAHRAPQPVEHGLDPAARPA